MSRLLLLLFYHLQGLLILSGHLRSTQDPSKETALVGWKQQKCTGLCPHATGGHLEREVQKAGDLGAELFQDRHYFHWHHSPKG